jgi:hypothetical protein
MSDSFPPLSYDDTIHVLGVAAALFGTLSYLIKNPRSILVLHAVSWGIWGVYFYSLSGMSGVSVAAVSGIVCLIGAFAGTSVMRLASVAALPLLWVLTASVRDVPLWSVAFLAPLVAATIETLSIRLREDPIAFRCAAIVANMGWLSYGLSIGAHASTFFAIINISTLIATLIKLWLAQRPSRMS